ncbi:efflux RND transporter periplasmic adaptor subunit [Burkholderia sp. D-99]|uniref:efflux RND transporter periplasmic adaptor subunit n=1 Tax=Burkholderia sp. D-99 TaxID=2717316 RepID=UPI00142349EE|nr:efflux RND transporter periplasmic adaptor subunit [Burkholderia sp. D-99]NHV28276.1 efflux RND transporter periplasmic adaptor subunit [Burkholderia sp. D-99]
MSAPQAAPPARRRARRWIVIVVLAVPVALIAFHLLRPTKPVRTTPAQVVSVATAATGDMPVVLNELGTVTPVATVTVLPQLSGYLTEVGYHEGQEVTKGQFLAQIDPRQYQISKQQAQAQLAKDAASLAQARADLARYAQLAEHQSIAAQTYQDAQFTVQQDEAATQADRANIAQYDLDLAYCHITAPVAGRVGLRLVDPGNYVTSSSTTGIVVITQMKPMTVQFTVPQNALSAVIRRVGAGAQLPVTVYSSDDDKQVATGTLYAIGNQMATATGTVTLRATFANDDEALFPNEFVNVRLHVDTLHDAVLVPTAAVQNGAPGDYVYLVNANRTVSVHKVTLGPSNGRSTAIVAGLAAGQQVVTDGVDRLSDGAVIRIASNRAGAALPASGASAGDAPRHAGHRAAVAGAASGAA